MNANTLNQNVNTLDTLQKANRNLLAKLAISDEQKAHEKSVQFLLNFELSQLKTQIDGAKKDVQELEKEQTKLIRTNQELGSQVKLIRNYFGYVNSLQVDRKSEHIQNLRGELSGLDFTLEERSAEPNRSIEHFTQVSRQN